MTKQEALENIYQMQNSIETMHLPSDTTAILMQTLNGCAKLITMIDKLE